MTATASYSYITGSGISAHGILYQYLIFLLTMSGVLTYCSSSKGGAEVAVTSAPCGVRGAKNRKMSASKDSEENQTMAVVSEPQQPGVKVGTTLQGDTG